MELDYKIGLVIIYGGNVVHNIILIFSSFHPFWSSWNIQHAVKQEIFLNKILNYIRFAIRILKDAQNCLDLSAVSPCV